MDYVCKDDRIKLYERLSKSQMVLIDQIKINQDYNNKDKFEIIQQCLSFFNHKQFYLILEWSDKIIINEYASHNKLVSWLPNEGLIAREIIKKV